MTTLRHLALVLSCVLPGAAFAQSAAPAGAHVYQQRLADGRIVLSDKPVEGAQIQRTWQIAREDQEAAQRRSAQMQREAQAVTERIQRRLDQQQARDEDLERERLRTSLAEARLDAEVARSNANDVPVLIAPGAYSRFNPSRFDPSRFNHGPRPGMRPGTGFDTRPGARPGTGFDTRPGARPDTRPGARPDTRPGASPGMYPGRGRPGSPDSSRDLP